ncbi:MAG: hypothetical protein GYB68_02120, partial [Chloroflexi bacterium]|nr:hypothetical protein [Chloroflexota bacterium]
MTIELLVWLIPVPPLVAFFTILLFTRQSKALSDWVAVSAMALTWVLSIIVLVTALTTPDLGKNPIESSVEWLPIGPTSETSFEMGVLVDPLSAVLIFFVPLAASMIFIYSVGYMNSGTYYTEVRLNEDGSAPEGAEIDSAGRAVKKIDATVWKARFMAFISLFAGGMLLLTVSSNLLLLFVGWEIMGLCSYLLIGFWHNRVYPNQPDRITPVGAGIKAFMTTRVGDMFMLVGIAWLYSFTGTLNYREILYNEEVLHALEVLAFPNLPLLGGLTVAGAIGLLLIMGTVGKSAQFPMHTWLPDAMEGPT